MFDTIMRAVFFIVHYCICYIFIKNRKYVCLEDLPDYEERTDVKHLTLKSLVFYTWKINLIFLIDCLYVSSS